MPEKWRWRVSKVALILLRLYLLIVDIITMTKMVKMITDHARTHKGFIPKPRPAGDCRIPLHNRSGRIGP